MCDASLNTLSHNSPVKVCVDITDLLAYAEYNNVVSGIQRVIVRAISQFVNEHGLDKLVHDLIPLVVPEHVGPGVPLRFEQWFRAVLGVCDVVFANSEATQRDIYRYSKLTGQLAPTVSTVPLAHEFQIPALPDNARHHIRIFNERSLRLVEHASQRVLFDTIEPYVLI
eukprot:gene22036-23070_t